MVAGNERARAQRRLARQVRSGSYERQFKYGEKVRRANKDYVQFLLDNPDAIRPEDEKMLARRASWAQWERKRPGSHPGANSRWVEWTQFYYHAAEDRNRGYGEG